MKWAEIVNMLSERTKMEIGQEHQQTDPTLGFLLEPKYLNRVWQSLSHDEQQVICYFLKDKGEDILTYREMEQTQFPIPTARFRLAFTKLRRLGIIYTFRRMWGELAYAIPQEMIKELRKVQSPYREDWQRSKPLSNDISYHIQDDLLQVLNTVRKKPLELTKKGIIPKKSLRILFEPTKINRWSFSHVLDESRLNSSYHPLEAMVLDLLAQESLLILKEGRLEVGEVESWLLLSFQERSQQLADRVYELFQRDPRLDYVYDLVRDLEPGQTFSLNSILASIGDFAPPIRDVGEKLLAPMNQLGLLCYEEVAGDILFMWNNTEMIPEVKVYVQPNFEILVPVFASLHLKWQLLSFATLKNQAEMWEYKLEKSSLRSYFEMGRGGEDLLVLLQSISAVPIPENVEASIKQWEKEFCQISFCDARVMLVSDSSFADHLEQLPSISSYLLGRIGERAFMVRFQKWESLVEELEKRGYSSASVTNLLQPGQEESIQPFSVLKQEGEKSEYRVESVFPDLEDALPGLRNIPRMWISNYSTYHESTLRDIIQRAVQLHVAVRLEWKGQEAVVEPKSITNKHGFWTMVAMDKEQKEREFPLNDIGKIQISLP